MEFNLKFATNYACNYLTRNIDLAFGTVFSRPISVYFYPTLKCNCRCVMCQTRNNSTKEMSFNEIKRLITDLRNWLGPFVLNISGGEPTCKKSLWNIVAFASSLGIKVTLMTNGTLITRKDVPIIKRSGLKYVNLSLDSLNPEVYKKIRGKDMVKTALRGINVLKECGGISMNINTVITKYNLDEIPELAKFANKNGLTISLNPLFLRGEYDVKKKLYSVWPPEKKVDAVMAKMLALKKKGYPILNSVKHINLIRRYYKNPDSVFGKCLVPLTLRINPTGVMYICTEIAGNASLEPPKTAWSSEKSKQLRKNFGKCKKSCVIGLCAINDSLATRMARLRLSI